jgi:hypothetical protein
MKSERRHELQQNSLASALTHAPEFIRAQGSKVLLVIIILLLGAILLNQRSRAKQETLQAGWGNIATARVGVERLARPSFETGTPAEQFEYRKSLISMITNALNQVLASDDRQLAAEAYLVRGDFNWTLANLPEIAGAATQPSLKLETPANGYLAIAIESYKKVTQSYSDQPSAVTIARFGLAAAAENEHDFAEAGKVYEQVKSDANTLPAYKTLAELKLSELDKISKPVYLAPATQPAATAASATTRPAAVETTK